MEHLEYVKLLRRSRDVSAECIVQNARIALEIVPKLNVCFRYHNVSVVSRFYLVTRKTVSKDMLRRRKNKKLCTLSYFDITLFDSRIDRENRLY